MKKVGARLTKMHHLSNNCANHDLSQGQTCTFGIRVNDSAQNSQAEIKVLVGKEPAVDKELDIERPVLTIAPQFVLANFKSQLPKATLQRIQEDERAGKVTIVPGMKKVILIENKSRVPVKQLQLTIPSLPGVSEDQKSTCVNGMGISASSGCTLILDGSLTVYPSGSENLSVKGVNADQKNQLVTGSSASAGLQIAKDCSLVTSQPVKTNIPLNVKSNAQTELTNLILRNFNVSIGKNTTN